MRPRIAFMRVADDVSDFGEPDMQRHSKAAVSDTRLQRELIAVAGVVDPGCACDHHHRGRARLRILTREENLTCRARPHCTRDRTQLLRLAQAILRLPQRAAIAFAQ